MNPIENMVQATMSELKKLADVDTIIGSAIVAANGTTIIPVSRVSLGFVSGGGEYGEAAESSKFPLICGIGSGITIHPVAFLVVEDAGVKVITADPKSSVDKLVDQIPQLFCEAKKIISDCRCKGNEA